LIHHFCKPSNNRVTNSINVIVDVIFILQKQVQADVCLAQKMVQNALDILRGAIMIVYPMNLPPHDVIRHEFENTEDLSGMQASLEVRFTCNWKIISGKRVSQDVH
jgi:hypothetical protein